MADSAQVVGSPMWTLSRLESAKRRQKRASEIRQNSRFTVLEKVSPSPAGTLRSEAVGGAEHGSSWADRWDPHNVELSDSGDEKSSQVSSSARENIVVQVQVQVQMPPGAKRYSAPRGSPQSAPPPPPPPYHHNNSNNQVLLLCDAPAANSPPPGPPPGPPPAPARASPPAQAGSPAQARSPAQSGPGSGPASPAQSDPKSPALMHSDAPNLSWQSPSSSPALSRFGPSLSTPPEHPMAVDGVNSSRSSPKAERSDSKRNRPLSEGNGSNALPYVNSPLQHRGHPAHQRVKLQDDQGLGAHHVPSPSLPRISVAGSVSRSPPVNGESTPVGAQRPRRHSILLQSHLSNDSFHLASPKTRHSQARQQLGVIGRLRQAIGRHNEEDEFPDVQTVYKVRKSWVYHDMSLPLSYYFIAAGHNSYLTGNQFTSKSGIKPIVDSLDGGCRVIELDLWSGKHEPKVLHGFTMTKPVGFTKCIKAIRKHAFRSSEFPLIITLENHCNEKNKRVVCQVLRNELRGMLFLRNGARWAKFPSPEHLCRKVLIRDKNDIELERVGSDMALSHRDNRKWQKLRRDGEQGGVVEFGELISIHNSKHALAVQSPVPVSSSRGEGAFEELQTNFVQTVMHTRTHLLRTYPAAKRVDSSNYNPMLPWSFGAQIVAMNWQTPGPPMWVYRGMFLDNGGCGFVKKPDWMLVGTPQPPSAKSPKHILRVNLKGARNLRHRTVRENYVYVEVHGVDKDMSSMRSSSVRAFDCCSWRQEYAFPLRCPELAVLMFSLFTDDMMSMGRFVGQAAIPLNNLNQGEFQLPLMNGHGQRLRGAKRHACLVVSLNLMEASISKHL